MSQSNKLRFGEMEIDSYFTLHLSSEEKRERLMEICKNGTRREIHNFIAKHYSWHENPEDPLKLLSLCCEHENFECAKYIFSYHSSIVNLHPDRNFVITCLEKPDWSLTKFILDNYLVEKPDVWFLILRIFSRRSDDGLKATKFFFEKFGDKVYELRRIIPNQNHFIESENDEDIYFDQMDEIRFDRLCEIAAIRNNSDIFNYYFPQLSNKELSRILIRLSGNKGDDKFLPYFKLLIEEHKEKISVFEFHRYSVLSYLMGNKSISNYILENFLNKEKNTFFHLTKRNMFLLELKEKNIKKWTSFSMDIDNYVVHYAYTPKEEDEVEFIEAFNKHLSIFNKKSFRSQQF